MESKACVVQGVGAISSRPPNYSSRVRLIIGLQDQGIERDCVRMVREAIETLGGLDVIVAKCRMRGEKREISGCTMLMSG